MSAELALKHNRTETVTVKIHPQKPVEDSLIPTHVWNLYSISFKEIQLAVSFIRERKRALIGIKAHLSQILLETHGRNLQVTP